MKTFSKIIALAAMVLMLANCDKQNRQETLSITPEELSFGEDGQTQSFIIETEEAWNITTDGETWYSVTPLSGQGNTRVYVRVEYNPDQQDGRTAVISITAESGTKELAITQERASVPTKITMYTPDQDLLNTIGLLSSAYYGISPNGRYAVITDETFGFQSLLWDRETGEFSDLNDGKYPEVMAYDVSDNCVIVGSIRIGTTEVPGYCSNGAWEELDTPEDATPLPYAWAKAVSKDGTTISGCVTANVPKSDGDYKKTVVPAVWKNFELQPFPEIPYGEEIGQGCFMYGASDDGSVIGGFHEWSSGRRSPAIWIDGIMTRLYLETDEGEDFGGGSIQSVSPDGTKAVGSFKGTNFYYDVLTGEITELGMGTPSLVTDDGTIYSGGTTGPAYIKRAGEDPVTFDDYISNLEIAGDNFTSPAVIFSVSENGRVLGGYYPIADPLLNTLMVPVIYVIE